MPSLTNLILSSNRLSGEIQGTFSGSALQILWLNNQLEGGMTGPIDVVATMEPLTVLWLHGNQFTGTIPENIGNLTLLQDLNLNGNQLVGLIPISLANMRLEKLDLSNNHLMGPIPVFKASKVTFNSNKFCQATPGLLCSPEVMALIGFLEGVNYPPGLFLLGLVMIPAIGWELDAMLDSLSEIRLQSNNLSGSIPSNWTSLKSLETLDLSDNNLFGPLPKFSGTVNLITTGNPLMDGNKASPTIGDNTSPKSSVSPSDVPLPPSSSSSGCDENFAPKNEIGRGGFDVVYEGALSKHLFHRKSLKLEPLSWKRRLNIALDVARGMEYLHTLAHRSLIHRDLKSSNILLGDDFRAKVSDFGLVKLAPDGERSVMTRLAGTFGYLAPEYAASLRPIVVLSIIHRLKFHVPIKFSDEKITTKADLFSFGVVLMELLTGLTALDDDRPEETQYLATWFWHIKSDMEKLRAAIDPAIDVNDETLESISIIAELARHCTTREPSQRPDMGHAVNVLAPLVEKWKPLDDDNDDYCGIDYSLPLNQMVKDWQEAEGKDFSYLDLEDIKGSIPARPTGFVESFTSADGQ
ncbi:hypothetical protein V6N13_009464 [Hibiscus sabdariffa]